MSDKVTEFRYLREMLQQKNEPYTKMGFEIGDFTYGNPIVRDWIEGVTLKIGKFCSIADNVSILLAGDHRADWNTTYPFNALLPSFQYIEGHPATKGDVIIGNDVWIASGAKILSGVKISDGCIIGANALVTKDAEPYSIIGGIPAKLIKKRFSDDTIAKLCEMQWWSWTDEQIVDVIPLLQSDNIEELYAYYLEHVVSSAEGALS